MYLADLHGSETVWRKWITAQASYDVDVSILAGDLSGKVIVPIVKKPDGSYVCRYEGREERASDDEEVGQLMSNLRARGVYPYSTTEEEVQKLKSDPNGVEDLFRKVIVSELDRMLQLAEQSVPPEKMIIVTPGNDDILELDAVIERHARIINPLGRVLKLPLGYEVISMDYSGPTPWNTPRECSEDDLWKKLEVLVPMVSGDWRKVICNFHDPPFGTRLDLAPKLDKNLRPVYTLGNPEFTNVGSRSVRRFLETYQPLLSLHGHIHEASGMERIGKTSAFNPGSEYRSGVLKAIVVDLSEGGISDWFKIG